LLPQSIANAITTLVIGLCGALLFNYIGAPVPWLIGPLVAVVTAGFAGLPARLPKPLRNAGLAILGTTIGTGFQPDLAGSVLTWLPTMLAMLIIVLIVMPIAWLLYRRYAGWSSITAALAAIPGGFATMALTAEEHGADVAKVSMAHILRIVSIIMLMPLLIQWLSNTSGVESSTGAVTPVSGENFGIDLVDALVLIACATAGPWIGKLLRLPASIILGAMLLSALVHISGLSTVTVPSILVSAVQVITGAWLGASFTGIDRRELFGMLKVSLLVSLLTLAPTLAIAWAIAVHSDFELLPLLLAFAPGGMPEMALIALVFDLDPMFVIGHHMVRMLVLVITGPILLPWMLRRLADKRQRAQQEEDGIDQ